MRDRWLSRWDERNQRAAEHDNERAKDWESRPKPRWVRALQVAARWWARLFFAYSLVMVVGGIVARSLAPFLVGLVLLMLASLRLGSSVLGGTSPPQ